MAYNPNNGTGSNKPYSVQGVPDGGRTYFYDEEWDKWRPYVSVAEILTYLDTPLKRSGQPFLVVNTGGVLFEGVITGGTNEIWYFKDGTENSDLVLFGNPYKRIEFVDVEGLVTIPFDSTMVGFTRPKTTAFNVVVIDEETGETEDQEITGYLMIINKTDGIITSITLDGIFGTGYILLTN